MIDFSSNESICSKAFIRRLIDDSHGAQDFSYNFFNKKIQQGFAFRVHNDRLETYFTITMVGNKLA